MYIVVVYKYRKGGKSMKKNVKLFSCVKAVKALREQFRRDTVIGFYGRHGRRITIRKAGYIMGFKEEVPCRKK